MTTLIIGVIAVISFIIGITLIYKGMANSPDVDAVVDHDAYQQVKSRLDQVQKEEEGLKLQLDSMTVELQDAKAIAQETEKFKKDVDSLRERDRQHQEMVQQLEESLHFLSRKADQQAKKAIDAIMQLNTKNQTLQAEVQEQISKLSEEDVEGLKTEKQALEDQLNENQQKIVELENALKDVQQNSEGELERARSQVQELEGQNESFQEGIAKITEKILFVENEFEKAQKEKERQLKNAKDLIDSLRREKQGLVQSGASTEEIGALESEISRVKAESEGRLSEAHQNVGRLQEEVNRLQREIQDNQHQREQLRKQVEESKQAISTVDESALTEMIEEQKVQLLQEKETVEKELLELREANQFLRQKERLLSQELLRSQTQALGLEKICHEFKKQIERR